MIIVTGTKLFTLNAKKSCENSQKKTPAVGGTRELKRTCAKSSAGKRMDDERGRNAPLFAYRFAYVVLHYSALIAQFAQFWTAAGAAWHCRIQAAQGLPDAGYEAMILRSDKGHPKFKNPCAARVSRGTIRIAYRFAYEISSCICVASMIQ